VNTLADLLSRPEGRTLEFKRQEVSLDKALRTLVAFANTAGGTLVLGVDDDGTPRGVDNVKMQEERFASAISDGIDPPLAPDLKPVHHEGVDLLLIRVPRFPGPFYLRAEGPEAGVYIRVGSTNRRASDAQREEMRRLATAQAFDERPCLGTTLGDVDLKAIETTFRAVGREIGDPDLETLGILVRHGDECIPSNGGIIVFGQDAARNRFFPAAHFRCARFLGTNKANILDRLDIEGSVLAGLDEVQRFIRRNTRMAARIGSVRRKDVPEYPPIALREVLANAVAHADYSQRGMPLRVQIYDDRLEVENPGGWPIGFSEEDFKDGISRVRNPVIARVLHELDIIEGWGSGYERVRDACQQGGYPIPDWHETGPVLRVRFAPHREVAEHFAQMDIADTYPDTDDGSVNVSVNSGEDLDRPLNQRQEWMLNVLGEGRRVGAEDIAGRFEISERTARRDIADLRRRELIAFVGPPKTGHYELARGTM
jgi:predicted HTH transcriptional regulator